MKKLGLCFLLLISLSGCSGETGEMERAMALRSKLLKTQQWSFAADITADYGERMYCFSIESQADGEDTVFFQITAPETIAGITGKIDDDGGKLIFDDTAVHFDLLTDEQLSPVSGPWILVKTLKSGYITAACQEEEGLRVTADDSYEEKPLTLDIWLDEKDLPSRAEILYNGRRILTLAVKNVEIV